MTETSATLAVFSQNTEAPHAALQAAVNPPREVLRWHAGWGFGVLLAGLTLALAVRHTVRAFPTALVVGLLPPLGGLILLRRDGARERDLLLVGWAVAGAFASGLSGGVSGPLAVWCAAPLAASLVLGGPRRPAQGAALSLLAVAVTGLAQVDRLTAPAPMGPIGVGLGLIGVISIAVGLAAALLTAQRKSVRIAEAQTLAAARREALLDQARADAEALNIGKSRFLANMSHELRTPLNAIMGFSDIMRQRIFGELPGRYGEYADLIHDAGAHLLDLINDVLDMSKIEAERYELSLERLDAREPVQAALRLMRLQADDIGVQLRGVLPSAPTIIDADQRALKQITLNLVSNALKFTPRGGLVSVSLQVQPDALELTVADTGLGIAAADLERLGRPYEQAGDRNQQARGTGLGLSLVRAFAELHGGEMAIESRLGEGTAVTVRLPRTRPDPPAGEAGGRNDAKAAVLIS